MFVWKIHVYPVCKLGYGIISSTKKQVQYHQVCSWMKCFESIICSLCHMLCWDEAVTLPLAPCQIRDVAGCRGTGGPYYVTTQFYYCIKSATDLAIPGTSGRERPRKTWSQCVKNYVNKCSLAGVDPQDKAAWRTGVRHCVVLPTPSNWDTHSTLISKWIRRMMMITYYIWRRDPKISNMLEIMAPYFDQHISIFPRRHPTSS